MSIQKLEELTEKLPPLSMDQMIKSQPTNNITEYIGEGGSCIGIGLYKNDDIAVQKVFMSKNFKIPDHFHEEKEWNIIFNGSVTFKSNGRTFELKKGCSAYFNEEEPHSCVAHEDTWMICITIPPSEGYPNGK